MKNRKRKWPARTTNATNRLKAAFKRKKEENTVQQLNKVRQDKLNKGKEILRQNQYNTYLQDEAATNFGTLSKGALKQQQKKHYNEH